MAPHPHPQGMKWPLRRHQRSQSCCKPKSHLCDMERGAFQVPTAQGHRRGVPHTAYPPKTKLDPHLLSWTVAKRPFSKGLQVPHGHVWLRKVLGWPDTRKIPPAQVPHRAEPNLSLQHNLCTSSFLSFNQRKKIKEVTPLNIPNSRSKLQCILVGEPGMSQSSDG